MRILGLDLGSKTIGVALSDEIGTIAMPLMTIKRAGINKDLQELSRLCAEHGVGSIVVGMPINMDGSIGSSGVAAQKFMERLEKASGLLVAAWDERLSTVAVTRTLIEADMSREKRKKAVDKLAASYILQGFLDGLRRSKGGDVED
ncbi:MAG: Holliday junction resolvase RuvX [Deltaproteobacteria bacterium]|nr:Holliday junction resolvase RuvX [Deltaproteobacteria bacterium]